MTTATMSRTRGRKRDGLLLALRVSRQGELVGTVLLNAAGRTVRCTPDLPADVILKVLARYTKRDELAGQIAGRDGEAYAWRVAD
jgi:hypothetical protein